MQPLWTNESRLRAPTFPRGDRPAHCGRDLPGLLGTVDAPANDAHQPLRSQPDGPPSARLSHQEHGSLSLQGRRRGGCRYHEEGNDHMVSRWLRGLVGVVALAACAKPGATASAPVPNPLPVAQPAVTRSAGPTSWSDSVLSS